MLGERYTVKKGDNLWLISRRKLGSGTQWPRIWKYNNRRDVIRVTGRAIRDPDHIYVGQTVLIPSLPSLPIVQASTHDDHAQMGLPTAQQQHLHLDSGHQETRNTERAGGSKSGLSARLDKARAPIAFKYRMPDDITWPPQDIGNAIVVVRMTGDFLLATQKAYPITYVTSRLELEHQLTSQPHHAFGRLLADTRVVYDPMQKRVVLRSMLISQSNTPNLVATGIGVEASSNNPIPRLRAEIRVPKLEGSIGIFRYFAHDMKVVVEITPKSDIQRPPPPLPERVRSAQSERQQTTDWGKVAAVTVLVTTTVVIGATLVEDFLTLGVGVVDDPVTMGPAAVGFLQALAVLGIYSHANELPQTATPAHVRVGATVEVAAGR
ncbi:MAG: hypothetical protein RL701_4792 [Pseudomonadota bacterium]